MRSPPSAWRAVSYTHLHGQSLRQQVVAAIAGLNRHHIAKATQVFHIGTKNDFHTGSP